MSFLSFFCASDDPMSIKIEFKGSKKINDRLKKMKAATQHIKGYDVGFFKGAHYSPLRKRKDKSGKTTTSRIKNPPSVAEVAAWQEFGVEARNIPERPFFRQANKKVESPLLRLIHKNLTAKDEYILDENEVAKMGLLHAGEIKKSITKLKEPPNTSQTVQAKGSSNPLIDTGLMRASATYKVVK